MNAGVAFVKAAATASLGGVLDAQNASPARFSNPTGSRAKKLGPAGLRREISCEKSLVSTLRRKKYTEGSPAIFPLCIHGAAIANMHEQESEEE